MEVITANNTCFNCVNCLLHFQSEDEYKKHYKSDYHRYNLKRKLLDLPPATLEQYQQRKQKVQEVKQSDNQQESKTYNNNNKDAYRCDTCNKSFNSRSTYQQHISSAKHQKQEQNKPESRHIDSSKKSSIEATKTVIKTTLDDVSICLFCDKKCIDLQGNLNHMNKVHGFFLSDPKYLVDTEGLLKYLAEKINIGNLCLYCENVGTKDFKIGQAVKQHMMDKGHCFMKTDNFAEYINYYNYSQCEDQQDDDEDWEDAEEDDEEEDDKENQQKKQAMEHNKQISDETKKPIVDMEIEEKKPIQKQKKINNIDDNEEDWESEEELEENILNQQEKDAAQQKKEEKFNQLRQNRLVLGKATFSSTGELLLPNGKLIGHRKYRKYYDMYYRPIKDTTQRFKMLMGPNYKERQLAIINQQKQLDLISKFESLNFYKETDKRLQRDLHRIKINFVKLGISHNKLQKHYRNQNPL